MGINVVTLALAKKMVDGIDKTHYIEQNWVDLEAEFDDYYYPRTDFEVDHDILKALAINRKTSRYFLDDKELFFKEDYNGNLLKKDYIDTTYRLSDDITTIYINLNRSNTKDGIQISHNGQGVKTFKIIVDNQKVKPIEEKYLINTPKSDWEEKDELKPSYILNRTHYKYDDYVERIEYGFYESGHIFFANWNLSYDFSIVYKFVYDGQIYNLRPHSYEEDISFGEENTPFSLGIYPWSNEAQLTFTDEQPHLFSFLVPQEFYKPLDKSFLPKEIIENNKKQKDFIVLKDQNNGYNYVVQMRNGTIITQCQCERIFIDTMPIKTTYIDGEAFDPSGMIVKAILLDGSIKEIDQYTYNHSVVKEQSNFIITYKEAGEEYKTTLTLTVKDFVPEEVLLDFEYVCIDKDNYLLTEWKGTYNGEQSSRIIIPDSNKIILTLKGGYY